MKIVKKLILLIVVFFMIILSNNAFAVISEEMSEEFRSILNEEGQLVITDTANIESNSSLLSDVINKNATDKYGFQAYFLNEENTKCRIQRYEVNPYIILESYDIDVVYEEKFSDEFKKITKDGNIIITSTSTQGKEMLLLNFCSLYRNNGLSFYFTDLNEEKTVGTLQMSKNDSNNISKVIEQHKVNISYEEKFSDEFKKITKDGNIIIKASREDGKNNLIYSYCSVFSDENKNFSVNDINEDGTLCTIQMNVPIVIGNTHSFIMKEEHIVKVQYDKTMSENFKNYLNKEGKFVIDAVKPNDRNEWIYMYEVLFDKKGIRADIEYLSEDLSSCEIIITDNKGIPETHKVEFIYNYDKKIKEFVDEITKKIPKDNETPYMFNVKDMELINYWLNGYKEDINGDRSIFDNYSSEFKEFVDYKNFTFFIDNRLGADPEFFTLRGGIALIQYKGTTYYVNELVGTIGKHILYVPEDTESTKEALKVAVQKRVDEYAGKGKVKISVGNGSLLEYHKNNYDNEIKELQKLLNLEKTKENPDQNLIENYEMRIRNAEGDYNYFIENYNNPNGEYYFLQAAEGDYWFTATIDGVEHKFIVVKDSGKMFTPKHKTKDFKTEVEVSTNSNEIPLDTLIETEKIIEGLEYEKIIKILDVKQNETFDINLYSQSLNNYVKKLENGDFEVRIPVPEKLKNKKLAVYYVNEEKEIEEFEVEIKDGFAIFKTNHFSIYTLAEKKEEIKDSENSENIDSNNVNNEHISNNTDDKENNNVSNPKTGDTILVFVLLLIISLCGIITILRITKNR